MIKFTKMQGIGNDYVYIDCINQSIENPSELSKIMSDRHFGIGSDGLILINKSDKADFKMSIFNSDGSEAEMCGNGIRCVAKFVYDKKLTAKSEIEIETLAGIKKIKLNIENNEVKSAKVDMGEPILKAEDIPVEDVKSTKSVDGIKFNKVDLNILDKSFEFTCVSMGNPHAITYIDKVNKMKINEYGRLVEIDKHFPKKINTEFIELVDKTHIKMRVWERGAGETMACGTGACAAVVSSILNGYTDRNVEVKLLGGKLEIEWNKSDNHVYMIGPAKTVFEGEFYN